MRRHHGLRARVRSIRRRPAPDLRFRANNSQTQNRTAPASDGPGPASKLPVKCSRSSPVRAWPTPTLAVRAPLARRIVSAAGRELVVLVSPERTSAGQSSASPSTSCYTICDWESTRRDRQITADSSAFSWPGGTSGIFLQSLSRGAHRTRYRLIWPPRCAITARVSTPRRASSRLLAPRH